MPRRVNQEEKALDTKVDNIFLQLLTQNQLVDVDMVWKEARNQLLSPRAVSSRLAGCTKRFVASGCMVSTRTVKTSERNGSSPIIIYRSTLYKGAK